jgi:lysophospholipase L1-like esterase
MRGCSQFVFLFTILAFAGNLAQAEWTGSWMASPQQAGEKNPTKVKDITLRANIRLSLGGQGARVRFSNLYGKKSLKIDSARAGILDEQGNCNNSLPLKAKGRSKIEIPAGKELLSDSVALKSESHSKLCISFHLPEKTELRTIHAASLQQDWLAPGNQTDSRQLTHAKPMESRFFLSGVEVDAKSKSGVVAILGDSITDGQGSTMSSNHRWPDFLADRIQESGASIAVLNAGISANRLLHDSPDQDLPFKLGAKGLDRFEREVLSQPGLTHAIVLLGINDIGHPGCVAPLTETVTAEELIAGYKSLSKSAHDKGIKIYGGTLLPFAGVSYPGFYSEEKEKVRQAVNNWIRSSKAYDGVIDFDLVMRDPKDPLRLKADFESGDHIHPNDAGYKAMADAVKLDMLFPVAKTSTKTAAMPKLEADSSAAE